MPEPFDFPMTAALISNHRREAIEHLTEAKRCMKKCRKTGDEQWLKAAALLYRQAKELRRRAQALSESLPLVGP